MTDSPTVHEISSGESSEEEEYEVERIVDHKLVRGRYKYLIKWSGYSSDENTWEAEENVAAPDLLSEYWKNHDGVTGRENKRKRVTTPDDDDARAMPPPPPRTPRRNRQSSQPTGGRRSVKYNDQDVIVDDAFPPNADTIDWEREVKAVELVGPRQEGGLEAIIQWNNGQYSLHPCPLLHQKCPVKLLQYYERMLVFDYH